MAHKMYVMKHEFSLLLFIYLFIFGYATRHGILVLNQGSNLSPQWKHGVLTTDLGKVPPLLLFGCQLTLKVEKNLRYNLTQFPW